MSDDVKAKAMDNYDRSVGATSADCDGQVPRALSYAHDRRDRVVMLLETLEKRLAPVLGPSSGEVRGGPEPRPQVCEIASSAFALGDSLDFIADSLCELMGRIEL